MPLFSKNFVDPKLESLKGYMQIKLTKNQLLKRLINTLLNKTDVDFAESLDLHDLLQSEQVILSNFENISNFEYLPIKFIDSDNDGDGNELINIYALLDETNKTYTLFGFFGTYSSWDGSEWDSIEPIELNPIEMYTAKIVK